MAINPEPAWVAAVPDDRCAACGLFWCPGRDRDVPTDCPQTRGCEIHCRKDACTDYGCQKAR
jgi:hypothetical protein